MGEPTMVDDIKSLRAWLESWGPDGVPNWSDPSGASVPLAKTTLRRLLDMSQHDAAVTNPPEAPPVFERYGDTWEHMIAFAYEIQKPPGHIEGVDCDLARRTLFLARQIDALRKENAALAERVMKLEAAVRRI